MIPRIIFLFLITVSLATQSFSQVDRIIDSSENYMNHPDTIIIDNYFIKSVEYLNKDLKKALIYAEQGIALSVEINDSIRIALGWLNLGRAYMMLGTQDRAMEFTKKALEVFEQKRLTAKINLALTQIASIYWYNNDYNTALEQYRNVSKSYTSRSDSVANLKLIGNIGLCLLELKDYDSAKFYYKKTLEISAQLKEMDKQAWALNQLGYVYLMTNKLDSSRYFYYKALSLKDELGYDLTSFVYTNLARIEILELDYFLAGVYLDSALHYVTLSNSLNAEKTYLKFRTLYYEKKGDFKNAFKTQGALTAINDSINSNNYQSKLANYKIMFELDKKDNEIKSLTNENEIIKLESERKQFLIYLFAIILFSSLLLIFLITRNIKTKREAITKLDSLNHKLKQNQEKLIAINEELHSQQEELFDKNKELTITISKLNKTQTQLVQSEKMASLAVLTKGVAHELINPLNFIAGGIFIIEDVFEANPQVLSDLQKPISMMNEGITRAVQTVEKLNGLIDQSENQLQFENLNSIIDNTLFFLNHKLNSDITIHREFAPLNKSNLSTSKIHLILFHLLINSIEEVNQLSKNKIIRITTRELIFEQKPFYEVKIFNTSRTIAEDTLNKLFDPFYTTKDPNKGVGMGLTMVYNLTNELNGTIAASQTTEGIEFVLMLPVNISAPAS